MNEDGTERLVLGDWGYSQHHIPGRRLRKSYGSLHYSAPEGISSPLAIPLPHRLTLSSFILVAAGTGYYGPEIDIWGVGVILFALLYGRLPFDGENDHTTRTRIIAAQYK
jgi:serine/threonine protein kinase